MVHCWWIDEIAKSLPLFRIASLLSVSFEVNTIHVDEYLNPAKPVLEIPFQGIEKGKEKEKKLSVHLVIDQMKDKRIPR